MCEAQVRTRTGIATGRNCESFLLRHTHVLSSSRRCRLNEKVKRNVFALDGNPLDLLWVFYCDLWAKVKARSPHMSDMIRSNVTSLERQQSVACEELRLAACLNGAVCRWAWQAVDERSLELCVWGGKRECLSVCRIADVAVCECVKLRREFMRWHLVSCLTFPVSQGSSFKNNAEEKPPTTDNWNATRKKTPALFVGDWIIAVAGDWRQGKCVSDCTVLVADTYHLPDSSTHPSPSTPHNSRNTLKKERVRKGRGRKINIVLVFSLPSPLQLSLTLTDEQWKYWTLLRAIFYFWVQNRAVKARRVSGRDWLICFLRAMSSLCSPRKALVSLQYPRLSVAVSY